MKIGKVFPDLLTQLGAVSSIEAGLSSTLRRLLGLTGADAGALTVRPPRSEALVVTATRARVSAPLDGWLRAEAARPARGGRVARAAVPGLPGRPVVLRAPLGAPGAPVGALTLVGRRLGRATLPAGFPRELGIAIDRVWQAHRRTLRMRVLSEITRLGASSEPLEAVLGAFGEALGTLVRFDGLGVSLIDAERSDFTIVDVAARSLRWGARRDLRMPLAGTLLARVVDG
ncbi:MAG: hypothetical protein ACREM3_24505, partial [Candidatus Rokuibacteriota bacterium]